MSTAPTHSDDMRSLLDAHLQSFKLSLARHEERMAAINAESARRIDATLARLDLDLDTLANQVGGRVRN